MGRNVSRRSVSAWFAEVFERLVCEAFELGLRVLQDRRPADRRARVSQQEEFHEERGRRHGRALSRYVEKHSPRDWTRQLSTRLLGRAAGRRRADERLAYRR